MVVFSSLLLPIIFAVALLCVPESKPKVSKSIFFAANFLTLVLLIFRAFPFLQSPGTFGNFEEKFTWLGSGFVFTSTVNPLSLSFCLLASFIYCIFSGFCFRAKLPSGKFFLFLLLIAQVGLLGLFLSGDAILFFVFWEAVLIPFYFILLFFGKKENLKAVSMKYIAYTMFGSLLFLTALLYMVKLYFEQFGVLSFAFSDWRNLQFTGEVPFYLFWGFMAAFLIKTPVFPVHSWQPATYESLPTLATSLFGALFSKVGLYGMLVLVIPLFPEILKKYSDFLSGLALLTIFYGAVLAFAQTNLKRVVLYSSISHLGFMLLGIASLSVTGIQGTVFLMVSHALITLGLFLGCSEPENQSGTLEMEKLGGLSRKVPVFSAIFIFLAFASIGLPGLSGFIGEFLILKGAFETNFYVAGIAALAIIFSAIYFLNAIQKVFYGQPAENSISTDSEPAPLQIFALSWIVGAVLVLGVFPMILLDAIKPAVQSLFNILAL